MAPHTQQAPPSAGPDVHPGSRPGWRSASTPSRQARRCAPLSVRENPGCGPDGQDTAGESCVYLIGAPGGGLVKVGTTTQLARRLRALQLSSPVPLAILWSAPGGRSMEAALHLRFAQLRQHGEWFDFGSDNPVLKVEEAITAGLPEIPAQQPSHRVIPPRPSVSKDARCRCGHELSFHRGTAGCTVAGWDEWLDCSCERFRAAEADWHVGMPACRHCRHSAQDHLGIEGPCSGKGACGCYHFSASGVGVAR
ncbi:GIY-YIG nuclease family protein [Streptomyces clavuligerus]|nr:GIY-YIG nuclease family protein [Streptomyces clavuligerus]QPJ96943.1 GIY-YIG nuclease family protein [Streptomyces clavuligerus]